MASETSPAAKRTRPLSPHLQVYKPQITSVMSITHRATGIALAAGTLLLTLWILSVAIGPEAHAAVVGFVGGWFGKLLMLGWTAALFYHLLNGIRHLFWDAGYGFELSTMQSSGYGVLIGTAVLTLIAAGLGLAGGLR